MKRKSQLLDFLIDDLTNSIKNRISGDSFQTEVARLTKQNLKSVTKKAGWNFSWRTELNNNTNEVYKLTIVNNPAIIQGLISLRIESDHVFMNLLESAPFNMGRDKLYEGVPGNLVAYACRVSFRYGYEGFVSFTAKTKLIEHYEKTLGAYHFGGNKMIIPTEAAQKLVDYYFKS
ncbi:MAG: hypothetical protein AAF632_13340 [Bacteroidota bacterium]